MNRDDNNKINRFGNTTNSLLFEKANINYISIPKVANTSIKIAIIKSLKILNKKDQNFIDQNPNLIHKVLKFHFNNKIQIFSKDKSNVEFALIRNPIDRFISFYFDKIIGSGWDQKVKNKVFPYFGFSSDMSLEDLISRICEIPDQLSEIHFRSQSRIIKQSQLYDNIDIFNIDHFYLFESYLSDLFKKKFHIKLINIETFQKSNKDSFKIGAHSMKKLSLRFENDFNLYEKFKKN